MPSTAERGDTPQEVDGEQCHKGDQVGENKFQKHVYANPLNPSVCLILRLAVMMFGSRTRYVEIRSYLLEATQRGGLEEI